MDPRDRRVAFSTLVLVLLRQRELRMSGTVREEAWMDDGGKEREGKGR